MKPGNDSLNFDKLLAPIMLLRSGKHWALDLFKRCGWLVKRRAVRRRAGAWRRSSIVAADCQILEQRVLLSTITVTSLADSLNAGNGVTLRDAIQAANTDASVDGSAAGQAGVQNVIVFQPGLSGTISLDSALGQMTISSSVDIQGLGAANTIIDAHHNSRIFQITSGAGAVTLDSLTIENGKSSATGIYNGGIYNGGGAIQDQSRETLTILNSIVTGNSTLGYAADGGAILKFGPLAVTNSTFSGNSTGGDYA
ncbi:MAG TPA: CSLREA domain-containing protein, partial [Planctomycetaceae bacterium]